MRQFILLFSLFLLSSGRLWAETIYLNDSADVGAIRGDNLFYYIDSTDQLTIDNISAPQFQSNFISGKKEDVVTIRKLNSSYWVKVTVLINATNKGFVAELFDFKIDYLELYIPTTEGKFLRYKEGAALKFNRRDYKHKNFVFDLPYRSGVPLTFYYNVKASKDVALTGVIRSFQAFNEYALKEYFYLSLFFGIILAMILYNIFLFFALKDITYLYYVLYLSSIGLYSLAGSGLGFQFLWPRHPHYNDEISFLIMYFIITFGLIYGCSFLDLSKKHPWLFKGAIVLLIIRSTLLILSLTTPTFYFNPYLDILPIAYIYVASIISLRSGNTMARFFVMAYSLFFLGFMIQVLQLLNILLSSWFTVYSLNFGVLGQMILLSLALADRIKVLTYEKEKAKRKMEIAFKEKELLKDKLNRELESKVLERTKALEDKSKELDTFIYRSSHDVKGPLKSILGLASLGLIQARDDDARMLFKHIDQSSKKLDAVLDQLLQLTEIKDSELHLSNIDFNKLVSNVVEELYRSKESSAIKIDFKINQATDFISDEKLLKTMISNIVANAVYHIDLKKKTSYLNISINVSLDKVKMEFMDNGVGIEQIEQEKIYDLFYKNSSIEDGNNVGLYITKVYVEKLGGSLNLNSEVGVGTSFRIELKNWK